MWDRNEITPNQHENIYLKLTKGRNREELFLLRCPCNGMALTKNLV